MACLKAAGTQPDITEELIRSPTQDPKVEKASFKEVARNNVKGAEESRKFLIMSDKAERETCSKLSDDWVNWRDSRI